MEGSDWLRELSSDGNNGDETKGSEDERRSIDSPAYPKG